MPAHVNKTSHKFDTIKINPSVQGWLKEILIDEEEIMANFLVQAIKRNSWEFLRRKEYLPYF